MYAQKLDRKRLHKKKLFSFFIATILMLGILIPTATEIVEAATWTIQNDGTATYGSTTVGKFTVNGEPAFCLEHNKQTPPTGTKATEEIYNDETVKKVLYYGWGGPEQWSKFTSEDMGYVITSLALDTAYTGGSHPWIPNLDEFWNYIKSQPSPPVRNVVFSKSKAEVYWHADKELQITETVSVKGDAGGSLTFTLPKGATLVKADGTRKSGKITLEVGDKFHFEAPAKTVSGIWNSGKVGENYKYQPIVFKTGSTSIQDLGQLKAVRDPSNQTSLSVKWLDFGQFNLEKQNETAHPIDGAVFSIRSNDEATGYNSAVEYTVNNGKLDIDTLPVGTYTVTEVSAPEGYLLSDPKSFTIKVTKDGVIEKTVVDKEPRGSLKISKVDSETGKTPQGDAILKGAEYTLFAKEDIWNKNHDTKLYSKGDVVKKAVTDKDGNAFMSDIYVGRYYLQETKAPEGYMIDKTKYDVDIIYKDQNTPVIKVEKESPEDVKKLRIKIFKAGIKEVNGVIPGLEGAEFTFKLKSDVKKAETAGYSYEEIWNGINKEGDKVETDPARIEAAQKIAPSRAVVTTDKDGNARTGWLPYGKYIGKETNTPKDYYTAVDFVIDIDKDASEIDYDYKDVYINNEQMESQIKIVKKDKISGKVVILDSATFKIKAAEDIKDRATDKVIFKKGEYIKQKVAGKWYDKFTTNAKGIIGTFEGEEGSVMLPLTLPVGVYEVEEIKLPNGFLKLENPVIFNIENIRGNDKDEDGWYLQEVVIENEQPKGEILIKKDIKTPRDEDFNAALKEGEKHDFTKIEFTMFAKDDIIDLADGSVVHKKDSVVAKGNLNELAELVIDNQWVGNYYIKETKTLPYLKPNDKVYSVSIKKADDTTKVIKVDLGVENELTRTEFTKVDAASGKEIAGATLQIIDPKTGEIITEWVSTKEPYVVTGLTHGKEYILKEILEPKTHVLNVQEVRFTVGSKTKVKMKDEPIKISGQIDKMQTLFDENGKYLYTVDYRSTSNTWADEYNMIDTLDCAVAGYANVTKIKTPVSKGDYDGKMNVWYKTNLTPKGYKDDAMKYNACSTNPNNQWNPDNLRLTDYTGWKIWKPNVSTTKALNLDVASLGLAEGEYITAVAFEHGRVEKGFTTRSDKWNRYNLKSEADTYLYKPNVNRQGSAVFYMQVVDQKAAESLKPFWNSADINIYRNLGGLPQLEDFDNDKVVQKYPIGIIKMSDKDKLRSGMAGIIMTGDDTNLLIAAITMGLALIAAGLILRRKADKKDEDMNKQI